MATPLPVVSKSVVFLPANAGFSSVSHADPREWVEPDIDYRVEHKTIDSVMLNGRVTDLTNFSGFVSGHFTFTIHERHLSTITHKWETSERVSPGIPFVGGDASGVFSIDLGSVDAYASYDESGNLTSERYESITDIVVFADQRYYTPQVTIRTSQRPNASGSVMPKIDTKFGRAGETASFAVRATPWAGFAFNTWRSLSPGVTIVDPTSPETTVYRAFPSSPGNVDIEVEAVFKTTHGPHPYPPPDDPPPVYPPDEPVDPDDPMIRKYGYIIVRTRPDDPAKGSTEPTEIVYAGVPGVSQTIRIVATANDGYSFLKWTDEYGADVATSEVYEQTLQFPGEGERIYLSFVGNFFEPSGDQKRVVVTADTGPLIVEHFIKVHLSRWGGGVQPERIEKYGYPGQTLLFDFIAYADPKSGTWFREWNTKIDRTGTNLGENRSASIPFLVTNDPSPQNHEVYACYDGAGIVTVCCAFEGDDPYKFYTDKHCFLGQSLIAESSGSHARSVEIPKSDHGKRKVYTSNDPNHDAISYIRAFCIPRDKYTGVKVVERSYFKDPDTGEVTINAEYETPWDEDFERPTIGYETLDPGPIWSGYIETQIIFVLRHPGTGKILHGANKKILHGSSGSVIYDG